MNDLFQTMTNGTPIGNMAGMVGKFNEFRRTFQGDPKQEVMNLLKSGRMTQSQFNQLQSMANMFQQYLR